MLYKNAPIKEALFDIRVSDIGIPIEKIANIHSQIIANYPEIKNRIIFQGNYKVESDATLKDYSAASLVGFIFSNPDTNLQVQFRNDGFTFNMIGNYTNWDEFSGEAFRLWEIYQKELKPHSITRIAIRYINNIAVPSENLKFEDYFTNMPPIPSCLPQTFESFFMRVVTPTSHGGTYTAITETINADGVTSSIVPFLLDIDTFKLINEDLPEFDLKTEFDTLRKIKNEVFEDCIKNKTRKLFN